MANGDGMFLYIGTYPSEAAARADYDVVKDFHAADVVGTYDASVHASHRVDRVLTMAPLAGIF